MPKGRRPNTHCGPAHSASMGASASRAPVPGHDRSRFHHPLRSLTETMLPSGAHMGLTTDPLDTASRSRTGFPAEPSCAMSTTASHVPSQGMSGRSQVRYDSRVPSGETRGLLKKSRSPASRVMVPSWRSIATIEFAGSWSSVRWSSWTASTRPRARSMDRSANRSPGVVTSGRVEPSGSMRHSDPSASSDRTTRPWSTVQAPPPYSCTRVRTLAGAGVSSTLVPSAPMRSSVTRPPSSGRDSRTYRSPSSSIGSDRPRPPPTTRSSEIGEGHEPCGTLGRSVIAAG